MSETSKRILAAVLMCVIACVAAIGEYYGYPLVKYLGLFIVGMMILEMVICIVHTPAKTLGQNKNWIPIFGFLAWLFLMLAAINVVGARPWIILLLLLIICAADVGAWFFGRMIGGDKMWERLSAGKTWAGQISGIVCGTFASVMYGLLGSDMFLPQLLWIGISISLLSQYGDLTASWIKRKMGLKDFGRILPGHGGVLDRFDGWIYVLPLVWFVML